MFFAICLLYIFAVFYYSMVWKRRKLPPGPTPWPLLGNLYEISYRHPHPELIGAWRKWTEIYGPVFTYWLGSVPQIVVTDRDLIQEMFHRDSETYAGRFFFDSMFEVYECTKGLSGIVKTQGEKWQQIRRFSLHKLRNLGMGRARMEVKCLDEMRNLATHIANQLERTNSSVFNCPELIDLFNGAVINHLCFGHGLETEEHLRDLETIRRCGLHIQHAFFEIKPLASGVTTWLRHIPPFREPFRRTEQAFATVFAIYDRYIRERRMRRREMRGNVDFASAAAAPAAHEQYDGVEADFLDAFLDQLERMEREERGDGAHDNPFSLAELRATLFDLHYTANVTTNHQLQWLLLYTMLDYRVQRKMQAELDAVAALKGSGEDKGVVEAIFTCSDKLRLPYTNAVINEAFRLGNLLPAQLARRSTRDVQIGDWLLPKGTIFVSQVSCVLADERIFPNPDRFLPERHLNDDGTLKKGDDLVQFGLGKRQCAGEALARMQMFLFTANFFDKFEIFPEDPLRPPSVDKVPSFTVHPHEFRGRIKRRKRGMGGGAAE